MKRLKLLSIIAILCISTSAVWSQTTVVAGWLFTGNTGGGSPFPTTTANQNVTIVGLTRGPGMALVSGTPGGNAWGGSGFYDQVTPATQTINTAITNGNFVTFSITPNTGYSMSLANIGNFNVRRLQAGPLAMQWQYSLDGINFTTIGTEVALGAGVSATGNETAGVTLSGIADLQNVPAGTTVTLRAVMWKATSDAGNWYFNSGGTVVASRTLAINGTVTQSAPLPLTLISFKGAQSQQVNHLNWITASEKNINHFELERADDGSHFTKVANINAAAKNDNNGANNSYSYDDNNASAVSFYRLKIVETGGAFTYSDVVVLRKGATSSQISLYPNPATSNLFVEGLNGDFSYRITDISGREISSISHQASTDGTVKSIDVSSLISGIYFIQLNDSNGVKTIRFVKE